jgi:hypothetical protein
MRVTSKHLPTLAAALAVAVAAAAGLASQSYAAAASGHALKATLTGAAETPPGDPKGAGTATLKVDPAKGEVCYTLEVSKIASATMAHIHKGAAGAAGPVAVPLKAPDASGKVSDCAKADAAVLNEILKTPSDYYVNVHNAQYPGGAVRGQLKK